MDKECISLTLTVTFAWWFKFAVVAVAPLAMLRPDRAEPLIARIATRGIRVQVGSHARSS